MKFLIIPLQLSARDLLETEGKISLKYFNKLKICNFLCNTFLKQKHIRRVTKTSTTSLKNWYFCFCSAVCDIHALNINWIYLSPFISDHCFAFSFWPVGVVKGITNDWTLIDLKLLNESCFFISLQSCKIMFDVKKTFQEAARIDQIGHLVSQTRWVVKTKIDTRKFNDTHIFLTKSFPNRQETN